MRAPLNPDLREWDLDTDLEKMAPSLADKMAYFYMTPQEQFRYPMCGMATQIVESLLHKNGITQTQQIASDIRTAIDGQEVEGTSHVILRATTDEGVFYIDSTYSQFFQDLGLDMYLIREGCEPFPPELSLVFREDDIDTVTDWLCDVTRFFWQKYNHSPEYLRRHHFSPASVHDEVYFENFKPPLSMRHDGLKAYFLSIYDLEKYVRFYPAKETVDSAEEIIQSIAVDTSGPYL